MARVTTEDCTNKEGINDHFELVAVATERTRQIISGSPITIPKNKDKYPVISLREIAADKLQIDAIKEIIINRQCRHHIQDNLEDGIDPTISEDLLAEGVEYIPNEHDFDSSNDTEFDNGMFSDDIMEDDDKII